jgi:hypothetical protein
MIDVSPSINTYRSTGRPHPPRGMRRRMRTWAIIFFTHQSLDPSTTKRLPWAATILASASAVDSNSTGPVPPTSSGTFNPLRPLPLISNPRLILLGQCHQDLLELVARSIHSGQCLLHLNCALSPPSSSAHRRPLGSDLH